MQIFCVICKAYSKNKYANVSHALNDRAMISIYYVVFNHKKNKFFR